MKRFILFGILLIATISQAADNKNIMQQLAKMSLDPADTTNFLRKDGTWSTPAGGSTPTGTGFVHVTSGVQDGAAKLVDTADINNDQITFAKIQYITASRLLGRDSSGGDAQEITLGTNLSLSGTTLNAASGSGNFVEVSLSMTGGAGYYFTAVTGQAWVSSSSKINCTPFGTTVDGLTPEQVSVANLSISVNTLIVGTGFTLSVYNPTGSDGTHRFNCSGS